MGWSIGYDETWQRDIGYGVVAYCDHPDCDKEIDRGLDHVCANQEPRGGAGCGLYFCDEHHNCYVEEDDDLDNCCERCRGGKESFNVKPEHPLWIQFKMTDYSWRTWRKENGHPEPTKEDRAAWKKVEREFIKKEG